LAITEWVGLVGGIPFFALVILIAVNVGRVLVRTRQTGNIFSPTIPLAGVLAAGLVHAAFEDWLFAVGYYLCIFFWALAFILVDVLPLTAPSTASAATATPRAWTDSFSIVTIGR
jgi:hypothetical protein